jgi:acyl-CoA thioesterase YciA
MHASDTSDKRPHAEPTLRAIAMPADANPQGDIFGGWLLSQMDLAGGAVATRRAGGRVFIGDEVTCYAGIVKTGKTSLTVKIESWVRRGAGSGHIEVTEGIFTYVAVDPDRKPRPLPPEG